MTAATVHRASVVTHPFRPLHRPRLRDVLAGTPTTTVGNVDRKIVQLLLQLVAALWPVLAHVPRFPTRSFSLQRFLGTSTDSVQVDQPERSGTNAHKIYFMCSTRRRSSVRKPADITLDATRITLTFAVCISDDVRYICFYISLDSVDTFSGVWDQFLISEDLSSVPRKSTIIH